MVSVEHGTAGEPRDFGEAAAGSEVTESLDAQSIEIGGADAVVRAREFGERSGDVPRNVMAGGTFALTPSTKQAGSVLGVWDVTLATGTDGADAQSCRVDMTTGEVTVSRTE